MFPKEPLPSLIDGLFKRLSQSAALLKPDPVEIQETHISWVLLAGEHAFKIKKPVNFGFLDFSTLKLRKEACEQEIRINQRYSPELYSGVVTITGAINKPQLCGDGPIIEYAVKMKRFPADQLFDQLAIAGKLLPEHILDLAAQVASFHAQTPSEPEAFIRQRTDRTQAFVEANFTTISAHLHHEAERPVLKTLHDWTLQQQARLRQLILARSSLGFIRECHGDLHLGNIVLLDGHARLFDGIEFNEDLRWIDTMSEIAFTVMDLEEHGLPQLGHLFLNRYLELTGDYRGVELLNYYKLYRAMVRAKVAIIQLKQTTLETKRKALKAVFRQYIQYGLDLIKMRTPCLLIMHGLSGSGKSYLASKLVTALPAICIRSDLERKRMLAGHPESSLYTRQSNELIYRHILDAGQRILISGHNVILDATFLRHADRSDAGMIAKAAGSRFCILDCKAPKALLNQRIRTRQREQAGPSDADETVLAFQINVREPLQAYERIQTLTLDMSLSQDIPALLNQINQLPSFTHSKT
jgi:aminoglycoside phosphotransferase family enzyme/predicted kinase